MLLNLVKAHNDLFEILNKKFRIRFVLGPFVVVFITKTTKHRLWLTSHYCWPTSKQIRHSSQSCAKYSSLICSTPLFVPFGCCGACDLSVPVSPYIKLPMWNPVVYIMSTTEHCVWWPHPRNLCPNTHLISENLCGVDVKFKRWCKKEKILRCAVKGQVVITWFKVLLRWVKQHFASSGLMTQPQFWQTPNFSSVALKEVGSICYSKKHLCTAAAFIHGTYYFVLFQIIYNWVLYVYSCKKSKCKFLFFCRWSIFTKVTNFNKHNFLDDKTQILDNRVLW